jgi:site-specific DNA recombinase
MTAKAILYARVSTAAQSGEDRYSVPQQLGALREYCEREGYEVLTEITDAGHSGASLARPGLDQVRDLVAAGGVNLVLAQDADRITRDPGHRAFLDDEMADSGCTLRALDDWGDGSHEGELLKYMKGWVSKGERLKFAERSRRGRVQKARQGKLIKSHTPHYGFRYTEDGNGYAVDDEAMRGVYRIFELVGEERLTLYGAKRRLEEEGILTPGGGSRWSQKTIRDVILDPVYEPHGYGELAKLVSPQVAAALDPGGLYGLVYYGRRKVATRPVSEPDGNGGRRYRKVQEEEWRPIEECVPIPVPWCGVPRELVREARKAIENNVRPHATDEKFYELSGGVFVCGSCGCRMSSSRNQSAGYYRCSLVKREGKHACRVRTNYRADALEQEVFEWVVLIVSHPTRLERELDKEIERIRRSEGSGDPEREAQGWLRQIEDLEQRKARAQDLAIEGLLDHATLRQKLSELDRQKETAQAGLAACRDRRGRIEDLQALKRELMVRFMFEGPELMSHWSPEQRNEIYRRLGIKVLALPDGGVEIEGIVELGKERSPTDTTYTAGTQPRHSKRSSPLLQTSCARARSATSASRILRRGRS